MGKHHVIQSHRPGIRAFFAHLIHHDSRPVPVFDPERTQPMTIVTDTPRALIEHGEFAGPVDGWLPTHTWLAQHGLNGGDAR